MGTRATPNGLVPVTVLAGYLGAGKTTLLNRLLSEPHGLKLGILVNDFGSINIDADLIAAHDGTTISLENGCVCCSIADSVGDALDAVLVEGPDHIVIEASGVAEPAKIAAYGQGWPGCRLAGVVVLADLTDIRRLSADRFVGDLVRRQLAAADVVVGTKADLLASGTGTELADWLLAQSFGAPQLPPDAPTEELLGVGRNPSRLDGDLGGVETVGFDTCAIDLASVARSTLEAWLLQAPASLARVKGIVRLTDEVGAFLVQRVGKRWSIEPTVLAPTPLVVIGPAGSISEKAIRATLAAAAS